MNNVYPYLAMPGGLKFAIAFTCVVIVLFVCVIVALWWLEVKKKPIKELFKTIGSGIYNVCEKIYEFFTANSTVKTVYSDKSLNYSGTEFLPVPTKAPTDKFTYEFVGWDKNSLDENGNFVVRAIYLQRVVKCYINVYDDDKATLLKSFTVEYGAGVNLSDIKPTKPETKEFTYEFVGWDKDTTAFYKNENVCAVYKAIPKKYTYTFVDDDNKTIISQGTALYGTPIISPSYPQKQSTDKFVYEFAGWKNFNEGMLLTKDVTFVATYFKQEVDKRSQTSMLMDNGLVKNVEVVQNNVTPSHGVKKAETKTQDIDNNEILQGSVGAQIQTAKKEENLEKPKVAVIEQADGTKFIDVNENDDEVHQKIQLLSKKETVVSDEPKKKAKKTETTEENVEDKILKNMVVNKVKINKKK